MVLLIQGLDAALAALRVAFPVAAIVLVVLCWLAWEVRMRRIQPFSGIGRLARTVAEPIIGPAERRLVRFGIAGPRAAIWAAAFYILIALATIALLSFLRDVLRSLYFASDRGSMGLAELAFSWTFGLLQLAVLIRVIMSWVGGIYSPFGRVIFAMTEWMLAPIRRVLPTFSGIDASPIVAWFAIVAVRGLLHAMFFA